MAMRSAAPSFIVPALTVVVPVYVLAPDSVSVPPPDCVRPPLPDTAVVRSTASDRLNASVAFDTSVVVASEPLVALSPTVSVPADTVRLPVKVLVAVSFASPLPDFDKLPLPEIAPAIPSTLPDATEIALDVDVANTIGRLDARSRDSVAESVPPLNVIFAGARSVDSEIASVPAEIVVAPV